MTSYATHMDEIADAMSIKYNNQVYELKQRGEDVIVLSFGEAYFDVPLYDFAELPCPSLYHYSHSRGLMGLRKKLSEYYGTRYGVKIDPATEIMITAGSKIGIFMTLLAILNPGEEVVVHEPTWVSYTEHLTLCHAKPIRIPLSASVFDFESYLTPKTRAIIVCNPNNPTGKKYTEEELSYLHQLCKKHGLYLISDEAYSEYFLDGDEFNSFGRLDPTKDHTILCNSMSKNFGISGWRIGYVVAKPEFLNQVLKLNQHLVTCPATVLEMYVEKHFDEIIDITQDQIRAVVKKRALVVSELRRQNLGCMPGDSTFYIFISIEPSTLKSIEFSDRLLEEYRVSTVPGIGFGNSCDKYVRISVGNEPVERIREGLNRIRQLIDRTSHVSNTVTVPSPALL